MKTKKIDAIIVDPSGEIIFEKKDFEIPETWSERAGIIVASKYATDEENSAVEIIKRVSAQIGVWGVEQEYFTNDELVPFIEKLDDILINQRASFNSPVWFNVGTNSGSDQCSACFILPVEDNMESILQYSEKSGMIFKGGSGCGVNVSKLRAKGELLSNRGQASGPVSFMKVWDAVGSCVKSGGKTRRAASLICMDTDHPDIMEFIECKKLEEDKARILIAGGVDTEEAYSTVRFQNANHSIRVTDGFMEAVEQSKDWQLLPRGLGGPDYVSYKIPAKNILRKAAEIAWETGDPGIQFHDRMNIDNPVPSMGEIRSTNPCFTGDTKISTANGYIPIKKLVQQATELGFTPSVHTVGGELSKPIAYMATGTNRILVVELSDGRVVKTTENHNWFINGEKIKAKNLEPGMPIELDLHHDRNYSWIDYHKQLSVEKDINEYRIKGAHAIEADFPTEMTEDFAEVLGHLTGDGYVSEGDNYSVGWIFGTHPEENEILHDRYKKVLDKYLPINTATNGNGCRLLRYNRQPVLEYFVQLGFKRCKAHKKRVPEVFFRLSHRFTRKYLQGYFGADGTVYGKEEEGSCSVNCASTSIELLRDIQLLLGMLGIQSWIKQMKKAGETTFSDGRTYQTRPTYRLSIDTAHIDRFKDQIGFSVEYKNQRLEELFRHRKSVKQRRKPVCIVSVTEQEHTEPTYNLTEPINNLVFANGVLIAQCSEFSAVDNSSCNLASLNLVKYHTGGEIDYDKFKADIKVLVTAMDILVEAADYPTPEIRKATVKTRPLGLGFTNLGAYLMLKGMPYDSHRARVNAKNITQHMTTFAYEQSIELAERLGPYKAFEQDKTTAADIASRLIHDPFNEIAERIEKHGLRNSQLTLLAPTGTISFMMDADTTGIEPLFALKSVKTLAGGGTMEIVPGCVQEKSMEFGGQPEDLIPEARAIFKTANEIHWKDHILMMAAVQPHLSGAISKTVNLPASATVEDVEEAYKFAWEQGLKSIAIYRDGSKEMQPLKEVVKDLVVEVEGDAADPTIDTPVDELQWSAVRRKLPSTRESMTHSFNIGGFEGYLTVGLYEDGDPGEIFINMQKQGSTINGLMDAFAICTSFALQYGVPLAKLAEKFKGTRFDPSGVTDNEDFRMTTSVMDYIFRWLAAEFLDLEDDEDEEPQALVSIIPQEEPEHLDASGPMCLECGHPTIVNGRCFQCFNCGANTGCS